MSVSTVRSYPQGHRYKTTGSANHLHPALLGSSRMPMLPQPQGLRLQVCTHNNTGVWAVVRPSSKLPTSVSSLSMQRASRSTSALLAAPFSPVMQRNFYDHVQPARTHGGVAVMGRELAILQRTRGMSSAFYSPRQ